MRTHAAQKHGIAVVKQVVRGDGGGRESACALHILRGLARGDVLEDDFELGKIAAQRDQLLVDEHRFAVKQIDVGRSDFAVHQQEQPGTLHGFQGAVGLAQIGDARIAVGGGPGGIELEGDHAGVFGAGYFIGRQIVSKVQRHQRLKRHALWHGRCDAIAVSQRLRGRGHGRLEVGHDDRAAELRGGVRHHGCQRLTVAHMQVPVVGAGQGEGIERWGHGRIVLNTGGRKSKGVGAPIRRFVARPTSGHSAPARQGVPRACRAPGCGLRQAPEFRARPPPWTGGGRSPGWFCSATRG